MKELSIEEKAQRYDETLDRTIRFLTIIGVSPNEEPIAAVKRMSEYIFPELKESEDEDEDERIRKALIKLVKKAGEGYENVIDGVSIENAISWLEKQGEHKPADKVKPKFKVGDWIITNKNHIWYIDETPETTSYLYRLINQYGKAEVAEFEVVDEKARLWTIQDAKDGDVLAVEAIEENYQYPFVAIYKERGLDFFNSYCSIGFNGKFHEADTGHLTKKIHPATKEQRDLLFQKMKEARYEWDADKKELKKIIDEKQIKKNLQDNSFRRMFEQNTAWSEKDERMFNSALWHVKNSCGNGGKNSGEFEVYNWLLSLKNRYTWKPSNEQIHYLSWIANVKLGDSVVEQEVSKHLNELLKDLKKLREE
jgi:hypothetical protein